MEPEELVICDPVLREGRQNCTVTFVERDHAYRRKKLCRQCPNFKRRSVKRVRNMRDDSW